MRERFGSGAFLALIAAALAACGTSQSGSDAANPVDGAAGADVPDVPDAASGTDVATGEDGPAGFFIVGDIDGQTWLGTYNITSIADNWFNVNARVDPSPPTREWQFNFTLPDDPFPYTLECVTNYIEFHELGIGDEREFVSRTSTSYCAVTFVEPAEAGTIEGTFTANLRLRGTMTDYLVTNGRFRLPRPP